MIETGMGFLIVCGLQDSTTVKNLLKIILLNVCLMSPLLIPLLMLKMPALNYQEDLKRLLFTELDQTQVEAQKLIQGIPLGR